MRKAETAIAIGNPLGLGFAQSITVGVISSPSRTIPVSLSGTGYDWEMEVIQTDAAINHGNSGGALVNLQGEVIGINSMKVADLGVEGMGFAIPVHAAKPVLESLLEYGKVKRPYMGVYTEDLRYYVMSGEADPVQLNRPEYLEEGIVVLDTVGPARKAGLRAMDIIVALDDRDTPSMLELRKYLYGEKQIGDELKVEFYRDGKMETVTLVLEESE